MRKRKRVVFLLKTFPFKIITTLLYCYFFVAGASAVDLNYSFESLPTFETKVTVFVSDENKGVQVDSLELLVGEKFFDLEDFVETRVGRFELVVENEDLLKASSLNVFAVVDGEEFQEDFGFEAVEERKVVALLKQDIPSNKSFSERASGWLNGVFWSGKVVDVDFSLHNYFLVLFSVFFVGLIAYFREWL